MNELRRDDFTNAGDSTANFVEQSYSNALMETASRIPEVVCLGVELSVPTESDKFRDTLPDRFFAVGMAEANAMGMASGMARMGDIPFVHSFGVFLTRRPYDQVAMQIAYPNVNVKMIGFLPGLTSNLGVSHQAIEDIALMRILPNLTVVEPAGPEQYRAAMNAIVDHQGPVYFRARRTVGEETTFQVPDDFRIGGSQVLRKGEDIVIFACGIMVQLAMQAAEKLSTQGIQASVVNVYSIKPIDSPTVCELSAKVGRVLTLENHTVIGGLGDAVSAELAEEGVSVKLKKMGLKDVFSEGASMDYLLKKYKLDLAAIVEEAKAVTG